MNDGLDVGTHSKRAAGVLNLGTMNAHVDHLLVEALGLPVDERSALAAALIDSLEGAADTSVSEAWKRELIERRQALRSGQSKTVPWHEARSRLSKL